MVRGFGFLLIDCLSVRLHVAAGGRSHLVPERLDVLQDPFMPSCAPSLTLEIPFIRLGDGYFEGYIG